MSNKQDEFKEDPSTAVHRIVKQMPILTDTNFPEWKEAIKIQQFVRGWPKEVFQPSNDQSKEDPKTELYQQRRLLWQVILLTTQANFRYLTRHLPFGDSGRCWEQICNHFERRNAQFVRDLTSSFYQLSMVRTGLGLKQFANRVVTDYQQIQDMGGDLPESQVRGVFIQGLIDDFKPKLLQVEKLDLPFHELIRDYAQKRTHWPGHHQADCGGNFPYLRSTSKSR